MYPGVGADDDVLYLETAQRGAIRLPLVRTAGSDVARLVDELLAVGGTENLINGAREISACAPDAVMWACTSGSFVYGWESAHKQAEETSEAIGIPASAKAADHPDAAMHSLRWLEGLEQATGRIVLTANQVTVREGLRIVGRPLRLSGLGTLFGG